MERQALSRIALFSSLPEGELAYLARALKLREIEGGTLLLKEGASDAHYFILLEGQVEVIKAMGTGDERLLAVRTEGSFIGEMSLFSQDGRHTASVRARTPLRLLEMTQEDLDGLLKRHPMFAYEMMRTLSQRLEQSENITIRDLRRKNRELLKAYRELEAAQEQIIEKERLEKELQVAREIQRSILPRNLPQCPEFDFGARVIPMAAIGGDFFDIIRLGADKWGIAAGDVTGHGVPAALLMAMNVTYLRAEARRVEDPGEVLRRINRHLLEMDETGMFVTMLYGELNCERQRFRYARAGHETPIILSAQGQALDSEHDVGQPLGLVDDLRLDEQSVSLPKNGLIFLYSDGVTDTIDEVGRRFGESSLITCLRENQSESAARICDYVWQSLQGFQGEEVQHDDVTLLAIKVK